MKRKPGFDDEFQPKRQRWSWPVRLVGWLMVGVAICGATLLFSVTAATGKYKRDRRSSIARAQRLVQIPQVKVRLPQPRDPFVVVVPAEIDAAMVVAAPTEIDEAMVFNPDRLDRLQVPDAAIPGTRLTPLPGGQPGQLPDSAYPPRMPVPAQPR